MCGRYELHSHPSVIALQFGLDTIADLPPRYNIAPQQPVAAVRAARAGGRELALLRWGLVPFWAKVPSIGNRLINARAETLASKPMFREAFRRRRCLLPADSFYEWRSAGGRRQPFRLAAADGTLLALAGLHERWRDPEGASLETVTIVTIPAGAEVSPIHDRMPLLLAPGQYDTWLAGSVEAASALLEASPAVRLAVTPVSMRVNDARNDDPSLIEPASGLPE